MNKKQRINEYEIGGTVYTVIAEESDDARVTQLDIINGLLKRHYDDTINSTNLLFATNGGKKVC